MSNTTGKMSTSELPKSTSNSGPQKKPSRTAFDRKSFGPMSGKSKIPTHEKNSLKDETQTKEHNYGAEEGKTTTSTSDRPRSNIARDRTALKTPTRGPPKPLTGTLGNQARNLENQFNSRRTNYKSLKKLIEDKQRLSEQSYEELLQLRDRIIATTGKDPGKIEDMVPMPTWSSQIRQNSRVKSNEAISNLDHKDETFVYSLEAEMRKLVESMSGFCSETIEKHRLNLVEILRQLTDEDAPLHLREQIEQYKTDIKITEARLEETKLEQDRGISDLVHQASCLWHQYQANRSELEKAKEIEKANPGASEAVSKDLKDQLRAEKDKVTKTRAKIRDLESNLQSSEAKLAQAQKAIDSLENQLKSKENMMEQRNKDLNRTQKAHEVALNKAAKEKESLELSEKRLEEQLQAKDRLIAEVERKIEQERMARQEVELEFQEFRGTYEKLEKKCKQLLETQEETKNIAVSDTQHSEYEIELFNALNETKRSLIEKEDMIRKLKAEREEIFAAVKERAEGDFSNNSKEKLAHDLMKRTNELESLTGQFALLQKNYEKVQRKNQRLEQKLVDMKQMQVHVKEAAAVGGSGPASRANYEAQLMLMQQQLADMTSSLADARNQNNELEKTCTQLQVKLEHCKRFLGKRDNGLRLRMELQQLLQHIEQSSAGNDALVNQQQQANYAAAAAAAGTSNSSMSEDYRQLYASLEEKELQILKLEKVVKQMEKQEEYSQLQRTRLESRIAKLDVALKEAQQAHRNRGFSFL